MRQENISYARVEACFYEAMRIVKGALEWTAEKEGNALIDPERTPDNMELIPHHQALNPSADGKNCRGNGIAKYHKEVTGRSARMNGEESQLSKAVGCIVTLPKDYLDIDYGLTEKEYLAVAHYIESGAKKEANAIHYQSALENVKNYRYIDEEKEKIREFFEAFLKAWKKVAGIRDEDMLYAVVHFDESFPHLHVMGLPTVKDPETGKITFSTAKYNNRVTHYYDNLHPNIIKEMKELDIDGSGLLNGKTQGRGFRPGDFTREQRAEGVALATQVSILRENKKRKEKEIDTLEEAKSVANGEALWFFSQCDEQREALKNAELKNKTAQEESKALADNIQKMQDDLLLIAREKEREEQCLEKIRQEQCSIGLTEMEWSKRQKELRRVEKNSSAVTISRAEYERNLQIDHTIANMIEREKLLAKKEKDMDAAIKEELEKILPEELRRAREDKAYCDKWLSKATALEEKEYALALRERAVEEDAADQVIEKWNILQEFLLAVIRTILKLLQNTIILSLGMFLGEQVCNTILKAFNKAIQVLEYVIDSDIANMESRFYNMIDAKMETLDEIETLEEIEAEKK